MKKIYLLVFACLSSIYLWAQPANDDVCNATMLTIGADCSATIPYTNIGATTQNEEPVGDCYGDFSVEQSVWFTFVPTSSAVSITTDFAGSGMQDNQLAVFELAGTDCAVLSNLIQIACNEDIQPNPVNTDFNAGLAPFLVVPGTTYYVQVDGYNVVDDYNEGSFCILVTEENPPSNDECNNAVPFGGFGPTNCKIASELPALEFNLTTIGATATSSLDTLSCDDEGLNATVYYSFPFGQDPTAEIEFQLLAGSNINVAVLEAGCDTSPGVAGFNCVTGLDASDPNNNAALFSGLEAGANYNLVIWTNEGEATDFDFCMIKRPEGFYECYDGECYTLAEDYANCPFDCPCESSIDLYSFITGSISDVPTGVCAEIINGTTDLDNPGIYIPFLVNTLDFDLYGSQVSTSLGGLFTNFQAPNFFGPFNPPFPLPNNEANNFIIYVYLTQAEIDAGGTVTISFTSDYGACSASIDFNLADLQAPNASECGNCNLIIIPDYSSLQCPGFNIDIDFEGAEGDLWLSQNNTIIFDSSTEAGMGNNDIALPYFGTYPAFDFNITIYDSGQPNCAFPFTLYFNDYICDENGQIQTVCRLDPALDGSIPAYCDENGNLIVPLDLGRVTGNIVSIPDVITGSGTDADPYGVTIDLNNCAPIEITVSDDSDIDQFSGIPIFNILSPASIEGGNENVGLNSDDWGIDISTIGFCGSNTSEVTGDIVLVDDQSGFPTGFCDPNPGTPIAEQCTGLAGNIALIDRGGCTFVNKASNAQQCGAIAVIICNNDVANPNDVIPMGGSETPVIFIPTIMLSYNDCVQIKSELSGGVTACIGAPETISGCERTFTVDVCNDYPSDFCGEEPDVLGCTDANACNYNPDANVDDGTCLTIGDACDDGDCSTDNDMIDAGTCACAGTPIQCPPGETFNPNTCLCEGAEPCEENISGSVTSPDPLCDLSGINIIITAPDGTMITVTTDSDGNFTVPNGPYPCGNYTAEFEDVTLLPTCYTDTGSTEPLTFDVDGNPNTDDFPGFNANPTIPTLSQWGLIVLALLLMTFGALTLGFKSRQIIMFQK